MLFCWSHAQFALFVITACLFVHVYAVVQCFDDEEHDLVVLNKMCACANILMLSG